MGVKKKCGAKALALSVTVMCAVAIVSLLNLSVSSKKETKAPEISDEIWNMHLQHASPEIAERHIQITRHAPENPYRPGYPPVHIYARKTVTNSWKLCGSGALLAKYPKNMLTAHHVFSGQDGQYGYRRISPKELTGSERIAPIVGYVTNPKQTDDALICMIEPEGVEFPIVSVPKKEFRVDSKTFASEEHDIKPFVTPIKMLAYPVPPIQGMFFLDLGETAYVFMRHLTVPGESGSVAVVEALPGTFLVMVRTVELDHEGLMRAYSLVRGRSYAVGNLVKVE